MPGPDIELTPFRFELGPEDHVFHNIYDPMINPDNTGNPRYGMTVRASAFPADLRSRSAIKTRREGLSPIPMLGDEPYILLAGGKKPKIDWRAPWTWQMIEGRLREAVVRNEPRDIIWRGQSIRVEGNAFEIGELSTYKQRRIPLPPGFRADTFVYTTHKITLL